MQGVVKIFDEFFKERKRYFSRRWKIYDFLRTENLKNFREKPKKDVLFDTQGIRNELDEHLEAINGNTAEIQETCSYMGEISNKLDKLSERLERIEVFLQNRSSFIVEEHQFDIQPLTKTEQHVFIVIYALEDEKGLVSAADIARKTGLPNYLVADYIASLTEKGVPIIRKYINNSPYFVLNPEFKRLQAIENILRIDTAQKELMNFS